MFGCDFSRPFEGTLFRFPLRNATTAKSSDIKSQFHTAQSIIELTEQYRLAALSSLLFLRNVSTIEVYVLLPDDAGHSAASDAKPSDPAPRLLFSASVQGRGAGRQSPPLSPSATMTTGALIKPEQLALLCAQDVVIPVASSLATLDAASDEDVSRSVPSFLALAADGPQRWQAIPRFILQHSGATAAGDAKSAFLSALLRIPEPALPRETHVVR